MRKNIIIKENMHIKYSGKQVINMYLHHVCSQKKYQHMLEMKCCWSRQWSVLFNTILNCRIGSQKSIFYEPTSISSKYLKLLQTDVT